MNEKDYKNDVPRDYMKISFLPLHDKKSYDMEIIVPKMCMGKSVTKPRLN
jgi:hypothetical protein